MDKLYLVLLTRIFIQNNTMFEFVIVYNINVVFTIYP
jgi:hypothetical protein